MKTLVRLVGAGPGDPELITLKGLKAIQNAKVLLYDALVSPELLENAPTGCKKVYVGKRSGQISYKQTEINDLLVHFAFSHGEVVRLKGGDPFVFGRGHEELEHLREFGIEVEVIPGISSALSLPALQQIPLTKRGTNESFWVMTATTTGGKLATDLKIAAQSSATVIILMGIKKLAQIQQIFLKYQRPDLPVAIIQKGSTKDEKILLSSLADVLIKAKDEGVETPGIIVIGDVVNFHPQLKYKLEEMVA